MTLRLLLEQHHQESYGWALACCGHDPDEASDVLQAVYLKVLEGRARFDGRSAFRTWIFRVIRNTAIDAARKRARHQRKLLRLIRAAPEPRSLPSPDRAAERNQTSREVRRRLDQLPPRQREVLQLVFYHGLSLREAASVMGVSHGSARTHYQRARVRFREWFQTVGVAHEG